MAKSPSLLPSLLLVLALFSHGARSENECQLERLHALEPSGSAQFEGGQIDWFDDGSQELQCAGVAVARGIIDPGGLFLPTYHNAPQLVYVVRGSGTMGRAMAGCAETFEDTVGGWSRHRDGGECGKEGQQVGDMDQKAVRLRQGSVVAVQPGVPHWCYNDADEPLVLVALMHAKNRHNQLDRKPRSYYLAGSNPQGQTWQPAGEDGGSSPEAGHSRGQRNLFSGFDPQILAEAFKVDVETAQKLRNQDDNRGNIVRVKGSLKVVQPLNRAEEEEHDSEGCWRRKWCSEPGRDNSLEEAFCAMSFQKNLDDPSHTDVYEPEIGRISSVNRISFPILRWLGLSALRGAINKSSLVLPRWNTNANELIYVTRGRARVQVANDVGGSAFDGDLREGQLLWIPQGFVVAKRSGDEPFEWISFKTSDDAKVSTLAGQTSAVRALPVEVIANAFRVSEEEARRIKFGRAENSLARTSSGSDLGYGRRADDNA